MKIKIKFNRDENIKHYGSEETEIELEEYVYGCIGAEIGNSHIEACKALAVAIRTNAAPYILKNKIISDISPQAFRASRLTDVYFNARDAAKETAGKILYYENSIANPASFSSNNGGRTRSSKERWGSARAWLIEQDDPWDHATKVTGHRVGLSQAGAKYAASQGVSYEDILSFYYPNTYIGMLEVNSMALATVSASWLIEKFKYMVDNHWKYIASSAKEGAVDCSGAFMYWYREAGSYMYNGSNTMWRSYAVEKGKISEKMPVPGAAVFKHRSDGKEPSRYQSDGQGNFYHVGLYLGNGKVAEARGTRAGCVYSNLSEWTHWAKLKYTKYDVTEDIDVISGKEPVTCLPIKGQVVTSGGTLNIRKTANSLATILEKVKNKDYLTITGVSTEWYAVTTAKGTKGYAMKKYIKEVTNKTYKITATVSSIEGLEKIEQLLSQLDAAYDIVEAAENE